MMRIFSGTPVDMMRAAITDLETARSGEGPVEAHFQQAMASLVGLYVRLRDERDARPSEREVAEFRQRSGRLLAELAEEVFVYVNTTIFQAESAHDEEWYGLCMRRSAIQSLLDDYGGTPAAGLVDRDDVAALDEELRRVGREQGPLPADAVPAGLPDGHWWWRYPAGGGVAPARAR